MLTVHKYLLQAENYWEVMMPVGARILTVDTQNEQIYVWALVDTNISNKVARVFRIAGTGHELDPNEVNNYVGTVFLFNKALVFHIFDLGVQHG